MKRTVVALLLAIFTLLGSSSAVAQQAPRQLPVPLALTQGQKLAPGTFNTLDECLAAGPQVFYKSVFKGDSTKNLPDGFRIKLAPLPKSGCVYMKTSTGGRYAAQEANTPMRWCLQPNETYEICYRNDCGNWIRGYWPFPEAPAPQTPAPTVPPQAPAVTPPASGITINNMIKLDLATEFDRRLITKPDTVVITKEKEVIREVEKKQSGMSGTQKFVLGVIAGIALDRVIDHFTSKDPPKQKTDTVVKRDTIIKRDTVFKTDTVKIGPIVKSDSTTVCKNGNGAPVPCLPGPTVGYVSHNRAWQPWNPTIPIARAEATGVTMKFNPRKREGSIRIGIPIR